MRITIHYLAQIKRAAGVGSETVDIAAPCTLGQLLDHLGRERSEAFRSMLVHRSQLFFVNDAQAGREQALAEGDEVTVLAPMAGG